MMNELPNTPPTVEKKFQVEVVSGSPPPPVKVDSGDGGGGGGTSPSLICPFLNGPCIQDRCMMWLRDERSTSLRSAQLNCAVYKGGLAALHLVRAQKRSTL